MNSFEISLYIYKDRGALRCVFPCGIRCRPFGCAQRKVPKSKVGNRDYPLQSIHLCIRKSSNSNPSYFVLVSHIYFRLFFTIVQKLYSKTALVYFVRSGDTMPNYHLAKCHYAKNQLAKYY